MLFYHLQNAICFRIQNLRVGVVTSFTRNGVICASDIDLLPKQKAYQV